MKKLLSKIRKYITSTEFKQNFLLGGKIGMSYMHTPIDEVNNE
tara:strand:- start:1204 stop:1332 length:129 start_codon:yes stop_codon:yes gene_type:complete